MSTLLGDKPPVIERVKPMVEATSTFQWTWATEVSMVDRRKGVFIHVLKKKSAP